MRADKCLRKYDTNYIARDISPYWLGRKWATWKARGERTHERESKCLPSSPAGIIRYVFPDYLETTALRVAACESTGDHYFGDGYNLYVYAKNPNSTASGLFQELSGWWDGSQNNYLGGRAFNPFNPWANTRQALWLYRSGGWLTHWSASVGCWG